MAGNVHSATDCKFEPKAYSLLPDEPISSNAAPPVAPNTIPNTMPNMVLPQVPTVNPNAFPVAQPVYPLHHPFPLGMGGYSFAVALPVGLPVFFKFFSECGSSRGTCATASCRQTGPSGTLSGGTSSRRPVPTGSTSSPACYPGRGALPTCSKKQGSPPGRRRCTWPRRSGTRGTPPFSAAGWRR